jgi:hypothetical protein
MRKLIFLLQVLFFVAQANAQAPNPKNIELAKQFVYFLDNGFEKIDLLKVSSVKRAFFTLGRPKLIIAEKTDKTQKNLVNSYSILVKGASNSDHDKKAFPTVSPFSTTKCNEFIVIQQAKSSITFLEIKLNKIMPGQPTNPKVPVGNLPVGFYLFLD